VFAPQNTVAQRFWVAAHGDGFAGTTSGTCTSQFSDLLATP
jgi:hypothetical protein